MKKGNLKEDIIRYLANNPNWFPKGELLNMIWKYPDGRSYMSETVGHNARIAEEESRIARKDDGISCKYKFLPPELRSKYIPYSQRIDKNILFKS